MKRHGNLYASIIARENILDAIKKAEKGRKDKTAVNWFESKREPLIDKLISDLENRTYKTSKYTSFTVKEPKERLIYCLPFYPDRILQHAILNVLKPVFMEKFTSDTYSCIEGRGIHSAAEKLKIAVRDKVSGNYYLKIDIAKYYPSIDLQVLKQKLRRVIKCEPTLQLVDEIINSHSPGLPIGNYLSQYLSNFYLSGIDHYVKEVLRVKHYFRYADDMLFIGPSKEYMKEILTNVTAEIEKLNLTLKGNVRISPVSRGIDFIGYKFYPTHTMLRKSIKNNFKSRVRKLNKAKVPNDYFKQMTASYYGWAVHCDAVNLLNTTLGEKIKLFK